MAGVHPITPPPPPPPAAWLCLLGWQVYPVPDWLGLYTALPLSALQSRVASVLSWALMEEEQRGLNSRKKNQEMRSRAKAVCYMKGNTICCSFQWYFLMVNRIPNFVKYTHTCKTPQNKTKQKIPPVLFHYNFKSNILLKIQKLCQSMNEQKRSLIIHSSTGACYHFI